MFFECSNNGCVVHTSAKINLGLEVLGRLSDGYHQVETLLIPVRLCDTLVYSPTANPLQLKLIGTPSCPASSLACDPEQNLVTKAAELLADETGRTATGMLQLHKRIPTQAGLGGGSSDAAATLALLNRAWKLNLPTSRLVELAKQLGTDVPFFLTPGAAFGTGRGEQLEPVPFPAGVPLVLVKPPVGLSTPEVFAALGLAPGESASQASGYCKRLVDHLRRHAPITQWRNLVRNSLQPAAIRLSDWIDKIADAFHRLPVVLHQMTGSGSGYYAVCRSWREARCIASRLRGQHGQFALATRTCL
ncbi:4-(cytidine 5'-diphospho)-2-C-methyl-D-erythritol kinase [Aeoliella mucimassa]|uniref:4-diphosphocytidyl-2-C-methyl-D-erythritol kinase n=1 Tax=Aeoliella mucimassa TaxID=2527972 RepID=A0A518AW67_9BACT|nr:4-(cytidine 5'-diphospho)-2-C-methyl-D-erythritol kinase [Aeoliella mucimassa]QDU58977.1 4-diphosphocytidyl-2-C-methyl-D-erythritol kinase [Aeoliella mucimassa]